MSQAARLDETELHAFVDGQVDKARAAEISAYLGANAFDAARVAGWKAQNAAIRRAYSALGGQEANDAIRIKRTADVAVKQAPSRDDLRIRAARRRAGAIALSFALGAVAVGGVALLLQRAASHAPAATIVAAPIAAPLEEPALAALGFSAYRAYADDGVHAVEIAAREPGFARYFAERSGLERLPAAAGARLIGGRLLPGKTTPAIFLLFETGDGAHLALVAQRASGVASARTAVDDRLNGVFWRANGFDYALTGPVDEARLSGFAQSMGAPAP
ncbi:MAG: hypothetical protein KGL46_09455 [Hyphomicrobiales bacterium]|nr:hypothetical protein [Hyphomicrobiales bacterium]